MLLFLGLFNNEWNRLFLFDIPETQVNKVINEIKKFKNLLDQSECWEDDEKIREEFINYVEKELENYEIMYCSNEYGKINIFQSSINYVVYWLNENDIEIKLKEINR